MCDDLKINKEVKHPPLIYYGGKWNIAEWVVSFMPEHEIYNEPFGGGSVWLRKERSKTEYYNDINTDVVNFFEIVRDRGEELIEKLSYTIYSREDYVRSLGGSDDAMERARRFFVVANQSIKMGGTESIPSNWRRVSPKTHEVNRVPSYFYNKVRNLHLITDRIQGTYIENTDAIELIKFLDSDKTLHYVDPPYNMSSRVNYHRDISLRYQIELLECLSNSKGKVILSGYDNKLYNAILLEWRKEKKSSFGGGIRKDGIKEKKEECLWMNF